MLNCGPGTSFADSQRVFIPSAHYNAWVEASQDTTVEGNPCCAVWKINGRCVTRASNLYPIEEDDVPAGAFIADEGPLAYGPQFQSCCDCNDTCATTTVTIDDDGSPSNDVTLTGCPSQFAGTSQTEHTINYSRTHKRRQTDNTPSNSEGGDFDITEFEGSMGGTTRWRNNNLQTLHSMGYTGGCSLTPPGGGATANDLSVFPKAAPVAFSRRIGTGGYEIPGGMLLRFSRDDLRFASSHPVPVALHLAPSFSYHGEVEEFISGGRVRTSQVDIEWSANHQWSCEYYRSQATLVSSVTWSIVDAFGATVVSGSGECNMSYTMEGRIICSTAVTNTPCCKCATPLPRPGDGLVGFLRRPV